MLCRLLMNGWLIHRRRIGRCRIDGSRCHRRGDRCFPQDRARWSIERVWCPLRGRIICRFLIVHRFGRTHGFVIPGLLGSSKYWLRHGDRRHKGQCCLRLIGRWHRLALDRCRLRLHWLLIGRSCRLALNKFRLRLHWLLMGRTRGLKMLADTKARAGMLFE